MSDTKIDELLTELEALKKLKILEMLDRGYSQSQIAKILGVSQPTISRMFPKGSLDRKD